MNFVLHILVILSIYAIISISMNILTGYTGIMSIAQAAFCGIGAYVTAILAINSNMNFLINIMCSMIVASLIGIIIAYTSLRLHNDYLVIATFGFQMIIYSIFNNWTKLTNGPLGLSGVPQPSVFGLTFDSRVKYFLLSLFFSVLIYSISRRLLLSPFGRVLKGIREDEIFIQSLGKNILRYKVYIFILSGAIAALGGGLLSYYYMYIDPTNFNILESIFIISIVVIGGAGNLLGSVVGAAVLIILPELLRFIGLPSPVTANARQIFYGILLVLFMMIRPNGFIGEYDFVKK